MNAQPFEGRRGIRYLGQYKPMAPYPLVDGLVIVPAGWGMFPYALGGEMRLNVSYWVGPEGLSEAALKEAYREWLAFDAFILHDHFPIYYFDDNKVGGIEVVPSGVPSNAPQPDYKQVNYGNIANVALMAKPTKEGLPTLVYSDLFTIYRGSSRDLKEMIEWFVSAPNRSHSRVDAFFNTNYWQLVHVTILLERLIGLPPPCAKCLPPCETCGFSLNSHYAVRRKDWLRQVLVRSVGRTELAEDYARAIEVAISIRNKFAHIPLFDRSAFPTLSLGERQAYDIDRAIAEYEKDSVALHSLLISLTEIARYLLLDRAFSTKYFPTLQPLQAVHVGATEPAHGGA